mmetsp:Transcript_45289/g.145714  ORF Transcript_45289/g.145714 Transcript_45289/m.145714 type:complete len:290 (-) Transcript_45289:814-1683(-)
MRRVIVVVARVVLLVRMTTLCLAAQGGGRADRAGCGGAPPLLWRPTAARRDARLAAGGGAPPPRLPLDGVGLRRGPRPRLGAPPLDGRDSLRRVGPLADARAAAVRGRAALQAEGQRGVAHARGAILLRVGVQHALAHDLRAARAARALRRRLRRLARHPTRRPLRGTEHVRRPHVGQACRGPLPRVRQGDRDRARPAAAHRRAAGHARHRRRARAVREHAHLGAARQAPRPRRRQGRGRRRMRVRVWGGRAPCAVARGAACGAGVETRMPHLDKLSLLERANERRSEL